MADERLVLYSPLGEGASTGVAVSPTVASAAASLRGIREFQFCA
jgi:hypothetical protein